jgi:hypothetical protein
MSSASVSAPVAAAAPRAPSAAPAPSSAPSTTPSSSSAFALALDWDSRKRDVLREFTVTGQISVAAGFLVDSDPDGSAAAKEAKDASIASGDVDGQQALSLDKARKRLQQLEDQARLGGSVDMTQAQYEQRITKLQRDLTRAWNAQQRVTSLKIAIMCAKLLGDHPKVPQFYPSMFVCVTEILDAFGRLVFERLRASAAEEFARMGNVRPLPDDFTAADVGAETKETCKNWFYKTSCIRELLPRLYIELSLLESYRFLNNATDFAQLLTRLLHSIRGIGDPLVAVYARWYLSRMAGRLVRDASGADARDIALSALNDYIFSLGEALPPPPGAAAPAYSKGVDLAPFLRAQAQAVQNAAADPAAAAAAAAAVAAAGSAEDAALGAYLTLHSPAVAWLCHQAGRGAPDASFRAVLRLWRDRAGGCALVLRHVLDGFDCPLQASDLRDLMAMAKASRFQCAPHFALADLHRAVALALARSPGSALPEELRLPMLNELWRSMTKGADPVAFARHAAGLVELLLVHYTARETLLLLGDLVKRLRAAAQQQQQQAQAQAPGGAAAAAAQFSGSGSNAVPVGALPSIERILTLLVEYEVRRLSRASAAPGAPDGGSVISSEHFGKLLDLFASEHKPALCRRLLASFVGAPGSVSDHVIVNTMFEVARACHDALDLLTPPEESAAVAALIAAFLAKVDFGRDLQRLLDLLTDCRQAFTHVDALKQAVIDATLALAGRALALVKGRHSAKTAQFVRSLFASVGTSIAGLDDPFARMSLSQRAARAALDNGCVSQADLLFRSAVAEIPELPQAMSVHIALSSSMDVTAAAQEQRLFDLLRSFAQAIVPMPGHPEAGPCYLARGLLNAVQKFPWARGAASPLRARSTLLVLPVVHALAADPLAPEHRVPGVDGNDVLYGGSEAYRDELRALQRSALEAALQQLEDANAAVQAGDAAARAVVLEAVPELLQRATLAECLALDLQGAVPFVERAVLMLRSLAPEHAAVGAAIAQVKEAIAERKRAGAGGG